MGCLKVGGVEGVVEREREERGKKEKSLERRAEGGNKQSEHIWIASAEYLCNIWKNSLEFKGPLLSFQIFFFSPFLLPFHFFFAVLFSASSKSLTLVRQARKYFCSNAC